MAAGATKTEALRLLRRRLSDVVYRRLQADETSALAFREAPDALAA